ncbi:MAG: hypothetical protein IJS26_05610 [Alphaproteobacteria bacterium]|nr:hypothetical protein [Alphaproteobacteria bacterium]
MKKLLIILAVLILALPASARYQKGYYKPSSGKYVAGHFKTTPDSYRFNNYSTKGNINPYTGSKGYQSPYKTYTPKSYK